MAGEMSNQRLAELRAALDELRTLEADEESSGECSSRQVDLEDALGEWRDILEAVIEATENGTIQ